MRIAASGGDVTVLKERLADATAKIAEARSATRAAKSAFEGAEQADTKDAALESIRTATRAAETKIKEAHQALVDVTRDLKSGQRVQREEGADKGTTTSVTQ